MQLFVFEIVEHVRHFARYQKIISLSLNVKLKSFQKWLQSFWKTFTQFQNIYFEIFLMFLIFLISIYWLLKIHILTIYQQRSFFLKMYIFCRIYKKNEKSWNVNCFFLHNNKKIFWIKKLIIFQIRRNKIINFNLKNRLNQSNFERLNLINFVEN